MFIEQVKIEGFSKYDISISLGPFFPGMNLLVGYDDLALFDALEFMFSDEYANMNENQFNELIGYDTAKQNENPISVEIFFDNLDQTYDSLPTKFSMKRTTNIKEDQYIFNEEKLLREEFFETLRTLKIDIFNNSSLMLTQSKAIQFAKVSDDVERLESLFNMMGHEKLIKNMMKETNDILHSLERKYGDLIESQKYKLQNNPWESKIYCRVENELKMLNFRLTLANKVCTINENMVKRTEEMIQKIKKPKRKISCEPEPILKKINNDFELEGRRMASTDFLEEIYSRMKNGVQTSKKEKIEEDNKDEKKLEYLMKMLKEECESHRQSQITAKNAKQEIKEINDFTDLKTIYTDKKLEPNINRYNISMKYLELESIEVLEEIKKVISKMDKFFKQLHINFDPNLCNSEKLIIEQLSSLQDTVDKELTKLPRIDIYPSEKFTEMHEAIDKANATIEIVKEIHMRIIKVVQQFKTTLQKRLYNQFINFNDNLNNIFRKFISNGRAELVFITYKQEYTVDQAENLEFNDNIGVCIRVSIDDRPTKRIDELPSFLLDDQKSVINLALILAIQQCSAIPIMFYNKIGYQFFDSFQRRILNNILKEMASNIQIFFTSY